VGSGVGPGTVAGSLHIPPSTRASSVMPPDFDAVLHYRTQYTPSPSLLLS